MTTLIDITFTDPIHGMQHVVVSSPSGGGGFHVYINDYFMGQIVRTTRGWQHYIESDVLTQDDIDAIMDAVNRAGP